MIARAPDGIFGRTTAARPRGHTFAVLDGLRGIAALLVVIRHAPTLFGIRPDAVETHLAVDLFFVLSGFVLAHAYEARIRDGLSATEFLRIRVVRLYPLYALGLTLAVSAALLSFAIGQGPGYSAFALAMSTACAALMLPTPAAVSAMPGAIFPLNFPSWSIFFEIIVNVAFFFGLTALSGRRLLGFAALCFVGLCLVSFHNGDLDTGYHWHDVYAGLIRVCFSFPVGVLLYRRWSRRPQAATPGSARGSAAALACLAVLTLLLVMPIPPSVKPSYNVVVAAFAFPILVYVAASITPGPRFSALCLKAGAVSYPLYILHAPCLTWLEAVGRRAPLFAGRLPAPWSGIVFLIALTAASLVLIRIFDTPMRQWLGTLTARPMRRSLPTSVELS